MHGLDEGEEQMEVDAGSRDGGACDEGVREVGEEGCGEGGMGGGAQLMWRVADEELWGKTPLDRLVKCVCERESE